MPWISVTESDVKDRLSGPELTAYKTAALATGQTDPLPGIITQTVNEARGYIAACTQNKLGTGETIPDKLLQSVVAIVRYRLITRLPMNAGSLLETRRVEYDDAMRLMREVAACRFAVEEPESVSTETMRSVAAEVVTKTTRRATREKMSGL